MASPHEFPQAPCDPCGSSAGCVARSGAPRDRKPGRGLTIESKTIIIPCLFASDMIFTYRSFHDI